MGANELGCAVISMLTMAKPASPDTPAATEKAIALIVNGFSKEVLNKLPMEFAVEAQKLLEISLEGSVG